MVLSIVSKRLFRSSGALLLSVVFSIVCASEKIYLNIHPQSLSGALLDFSYQSRIQLVMPGYITEGLYSTGLIGEFTAAEALIKLLKDTGLEYKFISANTVSVMTGPKLAALAKTRRIKQGKKHSYYEIEQIVVTAEGREEEIQDVSVSVAALNGEDLEKRGVMNADELQVFVPGLTIVTAQAGDTDFTIRGIGSNNDDITTDPGIGVFIDGVYIPRPAPANLAVFDLDRVEVLKGPQGTLFGRNTPGGAIKYITRKPSSDFEARYLLDIGDQGRFNNTVTLNGELVEHLYGQLGVAAFRRDGIMENKVGGSQSNGNNIDVDAGRISLRFLPVNWIDILFTADNQNIENDGVFYSLGPADGFRFDGITGVLPRSDPVRSANITFAGGENLDVGGQMVRADIQMDAFKVSYILGHREHDLDGSYDSDQSSSDMLREGMMENSESDTLEVRMVSEREGPLSLKGRVDWTAGLYFLKEKAGAVKHIDAERLGYGINSWQQNVENISAAFYGQLSYVLTEQLRFMVGARHNVDSKEFNLVADTSSPVVANPFLQESFLYSNEQRWSQSTPRLALTYRFAADSIVYSSYTIGYKPGGFEGMPTSLSDAPDNPFYPESSRSYEVGMKSKLFANRVKFNLTGFSMDYRNFQVYDRQRFGNPVVFNAPRVAIKGLELELEARPSLNLQVALGVSFLDNYFKQFEYMQNGIIINKRGDPIPRVPARTVNLSVVYAFPETQHGLYSLRTDLIYSDKSFDLGGSLAWPSYKVGNLWLDFAPPNGRWEAGLWVRNLTNEVYFRGTAYGMSSASNAYARKLEPPKLYGASVKYFW